MLRPARGSAVVAAGGPSGLVVKRGTWYLVATAPLGLRTYRVSRVEAIELTAEASSLPDEFDLPAIWESLQRDLAARLPPADVAVELLVDPQVWPRLSGGLGAWWNLVDPDPSQRCGVRSRPPPHA